MPGPAAIAASICPFTAAMFQCGRDAAGVGISRADSIHPTRSRPMRTTSSPQGEAQTRRRRLSSAAVVTAACLTVAPAALLSVGAIAQEKKPNILVIMADDIGYWNISAYNRGMMGYRTPNIDRIAKEGSFDRSRCASRTARTSGISLNPRGIPAGPSVSFSRWRLTHRA